MPRHSQPNHQIPGKFKLIFLGSCFLGCLSTIFLPYNSFHLQSSTILVPLNRYCLGAIAKSTQQNCGSSKDDDEHEEECIEIKQDVSDCFNAVIRAYNEINIHCIKYNAEFQSCSQKWCQGDETSEDVATRSSKDGDNNSNDDCNRMCKYKADVFNVCEKRELKKWFKRYGITGYHHGIQESDRESDHSADR